MSKDVRNYYRDRVLSVETSSLQWQVGKTINGVDVPAEQIEIILGAISGSLQVGENDNVLDVGCGNGLLTRKIAPMCSRMTGVEITPELYEVAIRKSANENIAYINKNIFDFLPESIEEHFEKIYLYEVLQHFGHQGANKLFSHLAQLCGDSAKIFIGGIPDVSRMWNFFNTPDRVAHYYDGLVLGNDPMGTWYHPNFFEYLAKTYDFRFSLLKQSANLYTSHYRYDCLFER
jgi:2-polyprenyl-3-methyl-5-hydroxy-6-metoxy-1,4-benzoquinol methylase